MGDKGQWELNITEKVRRFVHQLGFTQRDNKIATNIAKKSAVKTALR